MVKKFVKKPIPIEAIKCVKENESDIISFLNTGTTTWMYVCDEKDTILGFIIKSWEGVDPVYYDTSKNKNGKVYWIMKGIKGEMYPCTSDDIDDVPLGYTEVK